MLCSLVQVVFLTRASAESEGSLPPLDEVEGVTQPQGAQHEQQAEDGPLSRAHHQRLGQVDQRVLLSVSHQRCALIRMAQRASRLVFHLLQNLGNLLKHQRAVCGCQCGAVVEVLENWEDKEGGMKEEKLGEESE